MRDRLQALFANARRQPGQALVIFAIAAPALIAALGLGVDVAYIFKERRALQNVADMAALSGVSQLPDNTGAARTIAVQVATANGVDSGSVVITTGYDGNENQLEVSVTQTVDLFFMSALGFDSVDIAARAVAEYTKGEGNALFAMKDYQCWQWAIDWSGRNISVDGDLHSNAGVTVSGTGNSLTGNLTYDSDCPSSVRSGNPSLPQPTGIGHVSWPIDYGVSDFPCTRNTKHANLTNPANKHLWLGEDINSKQLLPGVICHPGGGKMTLIENGVTGNVTLVAEYIEVRGTGNNLTAYMHDVLMHAWGRNFPSMEITANGGTMNGIIYQRRHDSPSVNIPRGQVIINGSNGFVLNGSIVSWIMVLGGNNWSIINTLEGIPEPAHLVE